MSVIRKADPKKFETVKPVARESSKSRDEAAKKAGHPSAADHRTKAQVKADAKAEAAK